MGFDGIPCQVVVRDGKLHVQVKGAKTNRDYGCALTLALRPTVRTFLEWLPGISMSFASGASDYTPARICVIAGGVEILLSSDEGTEQLKDRYASEIACHTLSMMLAGGSPMEEPTVNGMDEGDNSDSYDPDDDDDEDEILCWNCGNHIDDGDEWDWDNHSLCEDCYKEALPACDHCGDKYAELLDDPSGDGDHLCTSCYEEAMENEVAPMCDQCGDTCDDLEEHWHNDPAKVTGGFEEYLCPDCLEVALAEDKAACDNVDEEENN